MSLADRELTLYLNDINMSSARSPNKDEIVEPYKTSIFQASYHLFKKDSNKIEKYLHELNFFENSFSVSIHTDFQSEGGLTPEQDEIIFFMGEHLPKIALELDNETRSIVFSRHIHNVRFGKMVIDKDHYHQEWVIDLHKKYKDWYYLTMCPSADGCFSNKIFRSKLEEKLIFQDYDYDEGHIFILFEKLTWDNFIRCFKIREYLLKVSSEICDCRTAASDKLIEEKKYWENI